MTKDTYLVAGAIYLIALLVAGIHVTTDYALTDALATGNTALRSAAEGWQIALAMVDAIIIIGITAFIKRDIRKRARA
jgi:DNA polymerase III alpha subunit